jgi:hypothetical protein
MHGKLAKAIGGAIAYILTAGLVMLAIAFLLGTAKLVLGFFR